MGTIDRIFTLMDKHNVNAATLTREADLTNGLITQWKKGLQNPSAKNILKISAYFNVNPNYLLCLTDDPTPIPTPDQITLNDFDIAMHEQTQELDETDKAELLMRAKHMNELRKLKSKE